MSGHDVRRDHFRFSKICLHFCALVFVILFGTIIVSESVSATGSWLDGDPELIERRAYDRKRDQFAERDCSVQTIILALGNTFPGSTTDRQARACMTLGKNFRTAVLLTDEGYETDKVYISVGWDRRFYSFYGWPYWEAERDVLYHVPGTDRVILFGAVAEVIGEGVSRGFKRMDVYDNFHTKLRRDGDYAATYRITGPATSMGAPGYADFTPDDTAMDSADWFLVYGWGVSMNGRYIVYSIPYTIHRDWQDREQQFIRIDTKTGEKRVFGRSFFNRIGFHSHPIRFAVSNDGKEIIASGMGVFKFWEVDSTCLAQVRVSVPEHDPCPTRVFDTKSQGVAPNYSLDDELYYEETTGIVRASFIRTAETVVIRKPGFQPPEKLTYLALGDSYSSGEGDITNGYVKGTEFSGGCHLSINSYPFHLRKAWNIPDNYMRSVACSGARIKEDYISDTYSYQGQDKRLQYMTEAQRSKIIDQSIEKFIPGIVPQLEFVRRYKPDVVTLTGGGNDVGFARILMDCASLSWRGVFISGTCSYANNEQAKTELLNAIRSQYSITKTLINKIRQVSSGTKVYIIGYPQFIHEPLIDCVNGAFLDRVERMMIREMVTEFNKVLFQAAIDAKAIYIDIEPSLRGGELCAGSRYVTGVMDLGVNKLANSQVGEAFHPNAQGHKKMAEMIIGMVPDVPKATTREASTRNLSGASSLAELYESTPITAQEKVTNDMLTHGRPFKIELPETTFMPDSQINVIIYSDATSLGSIRASSDGSVSAMIDLPKEVGYGRHFLTLKGATYSGESLTLYQFVTVLSDDINDVDADGIPDDRDKCMFIAQWFDEVTGKDVCASDAPANVSGATEENISTDTTQFNTEKRASPVESNEKSVVNDPLKAIVDSLWYGDSTRNELLSSGILGSIICVVIIMIARKRRHDIENQENK